MVSKPRKHARLAAGLLFAAVPYVAFAALPEPLNTGNSAQPDSHRYDAPDAAQRTRSSAESNDGKSEKSAELQTINVTGWTPKHSYTTPQTSTATGIATPTLDVPQSIQVIPKEVLRDQAAQSLADAMRNAPGVSVDQGEGNRDEFYIRGVGTKSDFFSDGLRDDTEYLRDLYNIAHVDVLQGPAALLFGRGGAGGIINLVTKQPRREPVREFTFETGSWQHLRGTLDVGGAIGESGAFRLMAMGEDSGGFRDHYYLHRHAINPKVRFQLGARTRLDFDVSYLDDRRFVDRGIPSRNGRPVDVPRERFFGSVDQNKAHSRVEAFNARITHDFSDSLTLRNAFRVIDNDRLYVNAYPGSSVNDQDMLKLKAYYHPNNRLSYLNRTELIADFNTGSFSHQLLFGGEYGWQRGDDYQLLPSPGSKTVPGLVPLSDPTIPPLDFAYLDRDNHVVGKEFGLYAEDQITLSNHWKALVGVRWDRFSVDADFRKPGVTPNHTFNVNRKWSPRVGLIYKPVENDSVYASVTQTFTPQGANIALSLKTPKGADLAPEMATNYEIGNKLDLFDGDLSITAALFQLNLKDVVSEAADGSGRLVNTGAQRNRGLSLSAEGALTSKWSIYTNYARLNAQITKATKDADAGARVGLVPRNQFSIWSRYALTSHWGIGAGLRGESEKYTSYDNTVVLPKYAVADLMAYYQAPNYRVQLNLNNVTDKNYYPTASGDDQIMPGTPRSVNLSVSMDF